MEREDSGERADLMGLVDILADYLPQSLQHHHLGDRRLKNSNENKSQSLRNNHVQLSAYAILLIAQSRIVLVKRFDSNWANITQSTRRMSFFLTAINADVDVHIYGDFQLIYYKLGFSIDMRIFSSGFCVTLCE